MSYFCPNLTIKQNKMLKKLLLMVLMMAPLSLLAQKFAQLQLAANHHRISRRQGVQAELEALGKQYQTDIETMQKEFQTKLEKYQKEVTDKTPANIRQRREAELQELPNQGATELARQRAGFPSGSATKFKPVQDKSWLRSNSCSKKATMSMPSTKPWCKV